jgi:hypothetical protein
MSPAQLRQSRRRPTFSTAAAVTSARAPRRCRKCPNHPLKSTCSCSKQRRFIPNSEVRKNCGSFVSDVYVLILQPNSQPTTEYMGSTSAVAVSHYVFLICVSRVTAQMHQGSVNLQAVGDVSAPQGFLANRQQLLVSLSSSN